MSLDRKYARVVEYVGNAIWAIQPSALATILRIVGERSMGKRPSDSEIRSRVDAVSRDSEPEHISTDMLDASPVAVIPVLGTLGPRMGGMDKSSGGTSTDELQEQFAAAIADPSVKAVLLDIDSPGGSVDLIPEFASQIMAARGSKPIVAQANTRAASAAYWIAAAADELVVSPSGAVGSIGVYCAHTDMSKADEMDGLKTTLISAGEHKTEANPYEPLTDEAKAEMQRRVDTYHEMFLGAVADGRGTSSSHVREAFGGGRMVLADEAVRRGMADRVAPITDTLARLEARVAETEPAPMRTRATRKDAFRAIDEWRKELASLGLGGFQPNLPLAEVRGFDGGTGDGAYTIDGQAALFGVRTTLRDTKQVRVSESLREGALDDALADPERLIHLNFGHDMNRVIAASDVPANKIGGLQLGATPVALEYFARANPEVSYIRDGALLMRDGVIRGASFRFFIGDEERSVSEMPDGRRNVHYTINQVSQLIDVCIAPQGIYRTATSNVRSYAEMAHLLDDHRRSDSDSLGTPSRTPSVGSTIPAPSAGVGGSDHVAQVAAMRMRTRLAATQLRQE